MGTEREGSFYRLNKGAAKGEWEGEMDWTEMEMKAGMCRGPQARAQAS